MSDRDILLDQVDSLRACRRWSVERLREEAVTVLDREEPVEVEELPSADLRKLVAAWERVNMRSREKRGKLARLFPNQRGARL